MRDQYCESWVDTQMQHRRVTGQASLGLNLQLAGALQVWSVRPPPLKPYAWRPMLSLLWVPMYCFQLELAGYLTRLC